MYRAHCAVIFAIAQLSCTIVFLQLSRGIASLFNKLKAEFPDETPEWTGASPCDDCSRLALCATRLEELATELAAEPIFRTVLTKMQCTLFQV